MLPDGALDPCLHKNTQSELITVSNFSSQIGKAQMTSPYVKKSLFYLQIGP